MDVVVYKIIYHPHYTAQYHVLMVNLKNEVQEVKVHISKYSAHPHTLRMYPKVGIAFPGLGEHRCIYFFMSHSYFYADLNVFVSANHVCASAWLTPF